MSNGNPVNPRLKDFVADSLAKTNQCIEFVESIGPLTLGKQYNFDMKFDEYCTQLSETKSAVLRFAEETGHPELLSKAQELPDIDYKDYEKVFNLHDWTNVVGGGVAKIALSAVYLNKIHSLKTKLYEAKNTLGTLQLMVNAA